MSEQTLKRYIRDKKGGKDSTDDQTVIATHLWEQGYKPTGEGIKKSELEDELNNKDIELEYTLGTSLGHLRDIDVVRRWIRGPQILVIHEDQGVINGEDLEPIVLNEIDALTESMHAEEKSGGNDESAAAADGGTTIRDAVAEVLNVEPSKVESHLRKGDVPDMMDKLTTAVEAIDDESLDKDRDYHEVFFIHNPYRYALTAKAVDIISQ